MQNDEPSTIDEGLAPSRIRTLASDFSLEVTPAEVRKKPGALGAALAPRTRV